MTFVTAGLAVAGLAATAIPILIHLLWRQRRTPVEWAAIRFLIEAYRRQRRRLRVEQLLLLAVRCLVLVVLGLALARPLLQRSGLLDGTGARDVYFVIDDGLVSGLTADGPDRSALDAHVQRAKEILVALGPGDRVGLITAARPARAVLAPPSTDLTAVADLLDTLEPRSSPSDLPGALGRLAGCLEDAEAGRTFVYLLSDFRTGSAPLEEALRELPPAIAERAVLLAAPPSSSPVVNTQITSIEPARALVLAGSADGSGQVHVRLARGGGELEAAVSRVHLAGDGLAAVEPRTVSWAPGQTEASVDFQLDFPDPREEVVGLTATLDADPLAADNERHATLELRKQVRVLLIDRRSFGFESSLDRLSSGQWMRRALEPTEASPMELIEVEPVALDRADLHSSDVAVLPRPDLLGAAGWTLLGDFVQRGGLLIITPPGGVNVHQWTDHLEADLGLPWRIEREVREHGGGLLLAGEQPAAALLRMIASDLGDLTGPIVTTRTLPVDPVAGGEILLQFADGSPLLVAGAGRSASTPDGEPARDAAGLVVYFAAALQLDWTNLPSKPLMVPLLHELVRQGLGLVRSRRAVQAGGQSALALGPSAAGLVGPDGARLEIDRAGRLEPLAAPGIYRIVDQARQDIGALAVNVATTAGRTDVQPQAAVLAWLQRSGPWSMIEAADAAAPLRTSASGAPMAGALLAALLVLVVVELLLARWFSHAQRGPGASSAGILPSMHAVSGRAAGAAAGGSS